MICRPSRLHARRALCQLLVLADEVCEHADLALGTGNLHDGGSARR